MRRTAILASIGIVVAAALWLLRDPAWLAGYSTGLKPVAADESGRPFRWTAGRASFYVPSAWQVTEIEMGGREDFRTQASIYVDGRLAGRLQLDSRWQAVPVATGAVPTTRRQRRIDIHVAKTAENQDGVRVRWPVQEK